jgi:1-phosphofructokinase
MAAAIQNHYLHRHTSLHPDRPERTAQYSYFYASYYTTFAETLSYLFYAVRPGSNSGLSAAAKHTIIKKPKRQRFLHILSEEVLPLIYTVTFNPSLDYVIHMTRFEPGAINRSETEHLYPGGKGINVALVLSHLGVPARMLGFTAGFTGREIERLCRLHGGDCDFVHLPDGNSRINVKISAAEETAVNGLGPSIPAEMLQRLRAQIDTLGPTDTLVLAGSIPASLSPDIYKDLLAQTAPRGVRAVVDATGDLLRNVLPYHPFLIKPNREELGELFGKNLQEDEELLSCAKILQQEGARHILVSLGGDGALLVTEDGQVLRRSSPQGTLVNSVGAGDSMVAGFLAGFDRSGGDPAQALEWGILAGSATAFHDWLATKEDIEALRSRTAAASRL